jgi:predicted nucleic acid-binding protein
MKAFYLDSSVALRFLFRMPDALDFQSDVQLISSALLRVECFRAMDRVQQLKQSNLEDILFARTSFYGLMKTIELVELNQIALERASQSFCLPIKTLDAIHLSTAMLYREELEVPLTILTHDFQFARVARSMNFEVLGC